MKRTNEVKNFEKSILIFTKRLQNCSTKKKLNNKQEKDNNNNKNSVTEFNNTTITCSKPSYYKSQRNINRSSSFVNSKSTNNKVLSAYRLYTKKSAANINAQKQDKYPNQNINNKNIKTSIMNLQKPSPEKNIKNICFSPSSPYTSSISSMSNSTSRQRNSNKGNINNNNRVFPSSFNAFIVPAKRIEVRKSLKYQTNKYQETQDIFKQKMELLLDNVYKEISKLAKKLAGIDYNKRMKLNEANQLYIKQLKDLYEDKEKKIIQVYDKYKYDLDNLKYRERKKYLEKYKNKTQELLEIEKNFSFEKEQIKTTYQMDYDLIKEREENEIQKILNLKIIEKTRNKLLDLLDIN